MDLKDKVPSLRARTAKLEVCWDQRDSSDTFKNTVEHSCRPAAPKKKKLSEEEGGVFFHIKDIPLKTGMSINSMKNVSAMETDN